MKGSGQEEACLLHAVPDLRAEAAAEAVSWKYGSGSAWLALCLAGEEKSNTKYCSLKELFPCRCCCPHPDGKLPENTLVLVPTQEGETGSLQLPF